LVKEGWGGFIQGKSLLTSLYEREENLISTDYEHQEVFR
jgi:hypothetical protein